MYSTLFVAFFFGDPKIQSKMAILTVDIRKNKYFNLKIKFTFVFVQIGYDMIKYWYVTY